ncbi:transposase [Streptomyces sp. NPDC001797]|uniref:transposase n=1 Tax=Streptomyces sp. NPDC001797 TaxID=3364610 RepID=UPI00369F7A15
MRAAATVPAASRGYEGGKKAPGRKRHFVTDTLGLVLVVCVTAANIGDRDAAVGLLRRLRRLRRAITLVWAGAGHTAQAPSPAALRAAAARSRPAPARARTRPPPGSRSRRWSRQPRTPGPPPAPGNQAIMFGWDMDSRLTLHRTAPVRPLFSRSPNRTGWCAPTSVGKAERPACPEVVRTSPRALVS